MIIAAVLFVLTLALQAYMASRTPSVVVPGLGAAVPILAGAIPAYMGANAVVHKKGEK